MSEDTRSRWLGRGRMRSVQMELDNEMELTPAWPTKERPPDPEAYRVRKLMEYLTPGQQDVLESYYFVGESQYEIAARRGCTQQAVDQMLHRAREAFKKVEAKHGHELMEVPTECL